MKLKAWRKKIAAFVFYWPRKINRIDFVLHLERKLRLKWVQILGARIDGCEIVTGKIRKYIYNKHQYYKEQFDRIDDRFRDAHDDIQRAFNTVNENFNGVKNKLSRMAEFEHLLTGIREEYDNIKNLSTTAKLEYQAYFQKLQGEFARLETLHKYSQRMALIEKSIVELENGIHGCGQDSPRPTRQDKEQRPRVV